MIGRRRTVAVLAAAAAAAATLAIAQTAPPPPQEPAPGAEAPAPPPTTPPPEEAPPPAAQVPPVVAPSPTPPVPETEMAPVPQAQKPQTRPEAPKPPPAPKRALYNAAVIQALDKVTTETLRFEAPLNQPIRYKGLIFTVHTCQVEAAGTRPPAEAHMEVVTQPMAVRGQKPAPAKTIFRGWMFAEAPGLHPLEHPVYDAWLIACKTAGPPVKAARR